MPNFSTRCPCLGQKLDIFCFSWKLKPSSLYRKVLRSSSTYFTSTIKLLQLLRLALYTAPSDTIYDPEFNSCIVFACTERQHAYLRRRVACLQHDLKFQLGMHNIEEIYEISGPFAFRRHANIMRIRRIIRRTRPTCKQEKAAFTRLLHRARS